MTKARTEKIRKITEDPVMNIDIVFQAEYFGNIAVLYIEGNKRPLYACAMKRRDQFASRDLVDRFREHGDLARIDDEGIRFFLEKLHLFTYSVTDSMSKYEIKISQLCTPALLENLLKKLEEEQ